MSLWETITGNSSLSVQPGNNLWDHLNSQQGGGNIYIGTVLTATIETSSTASIESDGLCAAIDQAGQTAEFSVDEFEAEINHELTAEVSCQL